VGVVSPSFAVRPDWLAAGVAALRRRRFRVRVGDHALEQDGYLAGPDAARAADLDAMLRDPEVRAVWFSRGGFGVARLLDAVDLAPLRRDPKLLVGHSDLTALFGLVQGRLGLPCLHGPFVSELGRPETFHAPSLRASLRGEAVRLPFRRSQVLRPGRARGVLAGGNLTVLAHTLGTPLAPSLEGSVLLLEDVGEEAYRLDRLLQHLRLAGVLASAAAVLVGSFDPPPTQRAFPGDRAARTLLEETLSPLGVPVVTGLPLGHVPGKWTVPLGGTATVDTRAGHVVLDPRPAAR
jgi:muramoyltetrapeptide carboxypeptidase